MMMMKTLASQQVDTGEAEGGREDVIRKLDSVSAVSVPSLSPFYSQLTLATTGPRTDEPGPEIMFCFDPGLS